MRIAATIKTIETAVEQSLLESDMEGKKFSELNEAEKEYLVSEKKFLLSKIQSKVEDYFKDKESQSLYYKTLLKFPTRIRNISRGSERVFSAYSDAVEHFEQFKNNKEWKYTKNISDYNSIDELFDNVEEFKSTHDVQGHLNESALKSLKKVYSADGIRGYYVDNYEDARLILDADNFGTWCIKEKKHFQTYGGKYYLFVTDKTLDPYALVSFNKDYQVKNKINKPFDNVKETDPIVNALIWLRKKGVLSDDYANHSHDLTGLMQVDKLIDEGVFIESRNDKYTKYMRKADYSNAAKYADGPYDREDFLKVVPGGYEDEVRLILMMSDDGDYDPQTFLELANSGYADIILDRKKMFRIDREDIEYAEGLSENPEKYARTSSVNTFYHGGKDLEYNWRDMTSNSGKGRFEYGPGLYLTTSYERARSYAKGGKKVYLVKVDMNPSENSHNVNVKDEDVKEFLRLNVGKAKGAVILKDLEKWTKEGMLPIDIMVNLLINDEAIVAKNTSALRKFMASNGAKYTVVKNFGGSGETVLVVIDPSIIKSVKTTQSKDVSTDDYSLKFEEPK